MIKKIRSKFNDFLPTLYSYKKERKLNDLSDFNFIYEYNFEELNSPIVSVKKSLFSTKILEKKSQNIGRFSGAKTFQQAKDLTNLLYDNFGNKTEFKEFKALALETFETYNIDKEKGIILSKIATNTFKFVKDSAYLNICKEPIFLHNINHKNNCK